MDERVAECIAALPEGARQLFSDLRELLLTTLPDVEEGVWARLPSYYRGDKFLRLIPFRDHINIEARAINAHRNALAGYKITPKGMLQLFVGEEVPLEVLTAVFTDTLTDGDD